MPNKLEKRSEPSAVDPTSGQRSRFSYPGLDRLLHERARLGIVTSLATHPAGLAFNDLKEVCDLTDGNLSRHLQVLLDQNLLEMDKQPATRRPQSRYRLTAAGRRRFLEYVAELEKVVADAAAAAPAVRKAPARRIALRPAN